MNHIGSECDLSDIVRQIVPNVSDDYHDPVTKTLPVLARPLQGLSVNQLFTLMFGTVPQDRICSRKPTSVIYSSVFVVDLTCVDNIKDLCADDNGAWLHGGKPRGKYLVNFDPVSSEVVNVTPLNKSSCDSLYSSKVVKLSNMQLCSICLKMAKKFL